MTPGTHALVDGAAVSAAPATAAPGSELLVEPAPVFGPPLAMPGAPDPCIGRGCAGQPSPSLHPAPRWISPAPSSTHLASSFGPAPQGPSVIPDPGMADPLSPTDCALAAIAEAAPDVRVLVSAAVLAMAAAAMVGPRASGSGTDVSMVFTNVRLLPCVVKESLARHVEMLTAANVAPVVRSGRGLRRQRLLGTASGTRGASAEGTAGPGARVREAFENALGSFRDGFEQAIRDERDDLGEGLRDSRLMLQIGMLLGFVYLGFLSVWFWATRVRGERRPGRYVR